MSPFDEVIKHITEVFAKAGVPLTAEVLEKLRKEIEKKCDENKH